MFEYDELASNAVKVLDEYNLKDSIVRCKELGYLDVHMVLNYLETFEDSEVFGALQDLSTDEFMEYVTTRYGIKWAEIIKYEMI